MKKLFIICVLSLLSISSVSAFSDIKNSDFRQYITNAFSESIISGYGDGTFRPDNPVSFVESLKMAINTGPQRDNIDRDMGSNWFTPFVSYYNNNYRVPSIAFSNDQKITRDFAVYILLRQLGIELTSSDIEKIPAKFPDIENITELTPYIFFAKHAGIVSGYRNGTFGPKNKVSRGEFTKMLWKSLRENNEAILQKYQAIKESQGSAGNTKRITDRMVHITFEVPKDMEINRFQEESTQEGKIATVGYGRFFAAVSQYPPQPRGAYPGDSARKIVDNIRMFDGRVDVFCAQMVLTDCHQFITGNGMIAIMGTSRFKEMGAETMLERRQFFVKNQFSREFPVITLWTKAYEASQSHLLFQEKQLIKRIVESLQGVQ
ncbi:hypothetical protein CSB09_03290 [Candidatus Gracilibacteria bacterium]|nr:MAG: hypothetical protein CSB09_03290 [Candidatus Gracilibacteria bacterium]